MYEWRTGRSCVYKNNVHLVFVTKHRRDVLTKAMLDRLNDIFEETCKQMQCKLLEHNEEHDHVHLMVAVHPKIAASNLVGKLKGKSSYFLRKEYGAEVKKKLWGGAFWTSGYFVNTVGQYASEDVIQAYVKNQGKVEEYTKLHSQQLELGLNW